MMNPSLESREAITEYVTFALGNDAYGVALSHVRELLGCQDVTRLSKAPPSIRGVVELRGKTLTVIDMRVELGMAPVPVTRRSIIIVVRVEGALHHTMMGLLVDEVLSVSPFVDSEVQPLPRMHTGPRVPFVAGIAKLDERLVVLLDLERLSNPELRRAHGNPGNALAEPSSPNELPGTNSTENAGDAIWSSS